MSKKLTEKELEFIENSMRKRFHNGDEWVVDLDEKSDNEEDRFWDGVARHKHGNDASGEVGVSLHDLNSYLLDRIKQQK